METYLIHEYNSKREGNDCLIYTYVVIMRTGDHYFVLFHTRMVGWFGTKDSGHFETFDDWDDAFEYFNKMKKGD